MKHFLGSILLLAGAAGCAHRDPAPLPPALYGSTWNLTQQTVAITDAAGTTTTTTTTPPPGALSYQFPGNGTYKLLTGGATAEGACEYDGITITLHNAVGAATTRVLTISALTSSQLVTVEKGQSATASAVTTATFTRQ